MKNTTIPLIGVLIFTLGGCTGSFEKVSGAMEKAPDWYEARRTEIGGEGYPELLEVPVIEVGQEPGQTLPLSIERVDELLKRFEASERAAPPDMTPNEIAAYAASIRKQFDPASQAGDHLTEADAEAIRQKFDVPRVTQGMKN